MRGRTLHVERIFVSRVPHQTCNAAMVAEMKPALDLAWRDLSWRPQFSASSDGLASARTGKQAATGADPD
jgi:hypothetical protein